ncbi:mechanosensitive ion channel domain-containing protein [Halorussus sp. MSC15.2]|uniref:mechanosensitive ion channel domain-containing protein n=1 Tax=Halorussus sp. MSC15.2 TaxID=2283638 RepID=UPI0013D2802D|nr:mechanosensitive ion channel domain-containing protein [Halorussus sp. MSC15.2]NEU57139.1 mechanosensitive ion channel [Halorussus sp. MSC15.2]
MQVAFDVLLRDQFQFILALLILIAGLLAGYVIGRVNQRLLTAAGVPEAVERTPFERTAQSLGTDTVSLVSRLSSWFIYGVVVLIALNVAELLNARLFWNGVLTFIPDLFIAILVFIVGFVVADKAELVVGERLRSVKLPEVGIIPRLVKYTIVYLAVLVALGQVNVAIEALLILLAAYVLAVILFGVVALWDLLRSSAAGVYLLLNQPYGIGDEVEVGDDRGIVQEVDVLVTRIENDGEEYIIPNSRVFEQGVVRIRD